MKHNGFAPRRLPLRFQAGAYAALARDQPVFLLLVGIDLLAKTLDIDVDDVRAHREGITPYVLGNDGARKDPAFITHEIFEQLVFLDGERNMLLFLGARFPAERGVCDGVEDQIARDKLRLLLDVRA